MNVPQINISARLEVFKQHALKTAQAYNCCGKQPPEGEGKGGRL